VQGCLVWRVDPERNLLWVKGQVPGHKGNFVYVKDAVKVLDDRQPPRPVPSEMNGDGTVTVAPRQGSDPFDYREG
jgi:large subunit ribosomal protein L3